MKFPIKLVSAILFALFLILVGLTMGEPQENDGSVELDSDSVILTSETVELSPDTDLQESEGLLKFYLDGNLFYTGIYSSDLVLPAVPEKVGYSFKGWYTDSRAGELFIPEEYKGGELSLFARYELEAPSFKISSLDFVYDGMSRRLAFSELTHPLSEQGIFI